MNTRARRDHSSTVRPERACRSPATGRAAAAVLLLVACTDTLAQQQNAGANSAANSVAVEVSEPQQRAVVRMLKMPASLRAYEQVDLLAKVSGYVSNVMVDIGDQVSKGQVVAKLSVPEMADELRQTEAILAARRSKVEALRATVAQAQRRVENAEAELERHNAEQELDQINFARKEELFKGNAIAQQAFDEARVALAISKAKRRIAQAQVAAANADRQAAEADVAVAQAEVSVTEASLARLRTLMEYADIKAPFDGVVTMRNIDRGTFVRSAADGATAALLRVAMVDRIRIAVDVPEMDTVYVDVGTRVEVGVPALGPASLAATVSRIARALDPETRTMSAEIDVENTDGRFAPGMYAQLTIMLKTHAQAMVVPSKAIHVDGGNTVVFVSANGRAQSVPVHIGYDDGIWAEILEGLSGEELVIIATGGAVSAGTAVRPIRSES